jgi:hypothetical protein
MVLNFFTNYLLAPIIFVVGLLGNIMGIIVISRKELKKIGPVLIYMFLFIFDSLFLGIFSFLFCKKLQLIYLFKIYAYSPDCIHLYAECIQL